MFFIWRILQWSLQQYWKKKMFSYVPEKEILHLFSYFTNMWIVALRFFFPPHDFYQYVQGCPDALFSDSVAMQEPQKGAYESLFIYFLRSTFWKEW